MRFQKNITIIGWGDVPIDEARSYDNNQVLAMVRENLTTWLSKPDKTEDELALVPKREKDLADVLATTAEGFAETTGIRRRQLYFDDKIGTNELAYIAAENALVVAEKNQPGFTRDKVGLIVTGSSSFESAYPSCGCKLQDRLGIPRAGVLDPSGACCSGTEALIIASAILQLGHTAYALVVAAEKIGSWMCDRMDKHALLWGDGAGALVLNAGIDRNKNFGLINFDMLSYGHLSGTTLSQGLGAHPMHRHFPALNASMEGRAGDLQRWVLSDVTEELLLYAQETNLIIDDRTALLGHNGNIKMLYGIARKLGIPPERVLQQIESRGNQSSASVLSTLAHYANQGFFQKGDTLIFVTFGGGAKSNFVTYRWP